MLRLVQPTPDRFRIVMGHFATGVTVVTTLADERPHGITVNALSSVSLDPPLIAVALDRSRRIAPLVRSCGRFAVNVLGEGQQALSDCFAGAPVVPDREAFCGAAWTPGAGGLPLLDGAIASLECTVRDVVATGDHDLFIAAVDAVRTDDASAMPLLYFRRRYLRIERAQALDLEGKPER